MFIFGIWFWLFDWKIKGSTKLSPAKCPCQKAQVTNATESRCCCWELLLVGAGTQGAGFCSFWELSPEIPATLGYETQLCAITEQSMGGKPLFKCWVFTSKAGVWEQPINKVDLYSCTETTWDPRLLSGFWAGLCTPFLRSTGKMTAMSIFWNCRVLQLQNQHKFVKGPNHSQSIKKQGRDKCRGKTEMYCTAPILG